MYVSEAEIVAFEGGPDTSICFKAERDEVGTALWSDVRVVVGGPRPPPLGDPQQWGGGGPAWHYSVT